MLADDVYDGNLRPARVVQIRDAVSQARSEMQQCARRFFPHARVAVCRSGDDAFEQSEHATHFGCAVERRDDVHFGRAWIRETGVDPSSNQRAD